MKNPKISLIAAIASGNRALGKDNDLIYKIPEDLKMFREKTAGHVVIMGRKTFESIGKPLPNRVNIVVTRDPAFAKPGIEVTHLLDEALKLAREKETDEIFIIGGGQIYQEAMPLADKLYLTIVEGSPEADTFFPDYSEFKRKVWQSQEQESDGFKYKFLELER